MSREEHIFVLEWGRHKTRLSYGLYSVEGDLEQEDHAEMPCPHVRDGLPEDTDGASKVVSELLERLESRHQLKVQTVFCHLQSPKLDYVPVRRPEDYLAISRHNNLPGTSKRPYPHRGELGDGREPVDIYPFRDDEELGGVFTLPALELQRIEKCLLSREIFFEDITTFPRLVRPECQAGRHLLCLGLDGENSQSSFILDGRLLQHRHESLCLTGLAEKLAVEFGRTGEEGMQMLQSLLQTPASGGRLWEVNPGLHLLLGQNLAGIRESIVVELEAWTERLSEFYEKFLDERTEILLLGEAERFVQRFGFLSELLPGPVMNLAALEGSEPLLPGRRTLLQECYRRRRRLRDHMALEGSYSLLSRLARRLLGR